MGEASEIRGIVLEPSPEWRARVTGPTAGQFPAAHPPRAFLWRCLCGETERWLTAERAGGTFIKCEQCRDWLFREYKKEALAVAWDGLTLQDGRARLWWAIAERTGARQRWRIPVILRPDLTLRTLLGYVREARPAEQIAAIGVLRYLDGAGKEVTP